MAPPLYMPEKDYFTYKRGKIWGTYPEPNQNINKNAFRQLLINKYNLKNNAEFQELYNRTSRMFKAASNYRNFINYGSRWNRSLANVIRSNTGSGGAVFLKKSSPYTWKQVYGENSENRRFFNNNKNKIVRIFPKFSNKYPELDSYYIEPNMTLKSNGKYMRPSNYLQFRQAKAKEHEMLKTVRKARGLEAMKPRLISALKRAQRKSRIREFFELTNELARKPNNILKRKFQNSNAEKARKKAASMKDAANKAAQNAINAQFAALRNNTRRLRERNEAIRRAAAGAHNANTWMRSLTGAVTRKNTKQKNNR
jgi:hypothetical protein